MSNLFTRERLIGWINQAALALTSHLNRRPVMRTGTLTPLNRIKLGDRVCWKDDGVYGVVIALDINSAGWNVSARFPSGVGHLASPTGIHVFKE